MLKSLDLSKHMITHMNKDIASGATDVEHINLDQNSISKLENISHLDKLQQLSAGYNCLIKICGLERLRNLTVLNLPENSICSIEGIGHLNLLVWLNLSGNNIRHITGLQSNLALKHLDLSDNTITALSNLSHLYALKALLLHGNIIRDVKEASRYLPKNLNILSLAENEISELSQVRNFAKLKKLEQLSVMNNPCVTYQQMTHHNAGYRAYVLSWACNLEVLDGQHVTLLDRQNSSQLLSDGVTHTFASMEQRKLVTHLCQVIFTSMAAAAQTSDLSHGDVERPVTAGGGERTPPISSSSGATIRKTKSDDKLFKGSHEPVQRADLSKVTSLPTEDHTLSISTTAAVHSRPRHSPMASPPAGSPLVSRKDMKGLIRQVIGQERSPGSASALKTAPKQSTTLPKMSRSRSASRSPGRDRTPASRKLIMVASPDRTDQIRGRSSKQELAPQPSIPPTHKPTDPAARHHHPEAAVSDTAPAHRQHGEVARGGPVLVDQIPCTDRHHKAAARIQALWRGFSTRNLDPRVEKVKQELRCRRLEETLAFVIGEMNRQQLINCEGQKIRSSLIAGIEQLASKYDDLHSSLYPDASVV